MKRIKTIHAKEAETSAALLAAAVAQSEADSCEIYKLTRQKAEAMEFADKCTSHLKIMESTNSNLVQKSKEEARNHAADLESLTARYDSSFRKMEIQCEQTMESLRKCEGFVKEKDDRIVRLEDQVKILTEDYYLRLNRIYVREVVSRCRESLVQSTGRLPSRSATTSMWENFISTISDQEFNAWCQGVAFDAANPFGCCLVRSVVVSCRD